MKITNFLFTGAPHNCGEARRRTSNLEKIKSCVWFALVRAEKVKKMGVNYLGISDSSNCCNSTVLPVPVGPQHNTWNPFYINVLLTYL